MSPIPVGLIVRVINLLVAIRVIREGIHYSRDGHDLIREHDLKTERDRERDREREEGDQEELYGSVDREIVLQRIHEEQIRNHLKESGFRLLVIGAFHLFVAVAFLESYGIFLGVILGTIWIILAYQAFVFPRRRLLAYIGAACLAEGLLTIFWSVLFMDDNSGFLLGAMLGIGGTLVYWGAQDIRTVVENDLS